MCRLFYATSKNLEESFLTDFFKELEKSAGGDGLGIGGFIKGSPHIHKSVSQKIEDMVKEIKTKEWDNGFLFHTRRASVGSINNDNCHPFVHNNIITVHNGHVDGAGVLKLMMLENIERYSKDGWTEEKISKTTDSDLLGYFISKRGFDIVPAMQCGTVMSLYPNELRIHNGWSLEGMVWDGVAIFASEIPPELGMASQCWRVFSKDSNLIVKPNGSYKLLSGFDVDGKQLHIETQKRRKKKKGKFEVVEVAT